MVETQSAFLTVKFKLHNPSQRRRAMLVDAMRRAHLGYDKIPKAIRSDVDAIVAMEERKNRFEGYRQLQRRLLDLTKPLPLGAGPKQAIIADALAQAESYVELKRDYNNTPYPTTPRLKGEQTDFDDAIDGTGDLPSRDESWLT